MSKRQQTIMTYMLSKILFFGLGISYCMSNARQNSWLAIILGYLLGLIILNFLMKRKLSNICQDWWGKIIFLLLISMMLLNAIIAYSAQVINFYLPSTPAIVIALTFLAMMIYGLSKDIGTLGRATELALYTGVLILIIGIGGNIKNWDLANFGPLLYNLNWSFFKAVIAVSAYSLAPTILLMMHEDNLDKKSIILGYLLSALVSFLIVFSTVATLGVTLSAAYRYPEYTAFKKINALNFLERIENILAFMWLVDIAFLGILSGLGLKKCFKLKWAIIISIIAVLSTIYLFINIYQNALFVYHNSIYGIWLIIGILMITRKKESTL